MAIDVSPNFTVALRGYDKDQVDQYLESISERSSEADDQLYEMQEQTRYLENERERMLGRVEELEEAIRTETPHTIAALGQRMTLILSEAEEGAADTVSQAEARATYLVSEAEKEAETVRRQAEMFAAQANETLAGAQRQAEALAERLEAEARSRAGSIVGDAQLRAQRRHDQIESWAQEVIARTQAEQARMVEEFGQIRRQHEAEVQALLVERDDAIAALRSLQGSLNRAINRVPVDPQPSISTPTLAPAPAISAERAQERVEHTGSHKAIGPAEDDTKLNSGSEADRAAS
jgi:DivIVA domain-containing protein